MVEVVQGLRAVAWGRSMQQSDVCLLPMRITLEAVTIY
jgi:hypothetical protein